MPVFRIFAVALIALYCLGSATYTLTHWDTQGWYGWNVGPDGSTVIWITPGYPADKAGIKVGDRIDWATLPLPVRANAILVQPADTVHAQRILVRRGDSIRALFMRGRRLPPGYIAATDIAALAGCVVIAIALALVLLRPARMTWGFLCSILVAAMPAAWTQAQRSAAAFLFVNVGFALMLGLQAMGALMFATRFPGDVARGRLKLVDHAAVPAGIAVATLWISVDFTILLSKSSPPPHLVLVVNQFVSPLLVTTVALASLLTTAVVTRGSDRQRVVPVITAYGLVIAFATAGNVYSALYTSVPVQSLMSTLTALASIALAGAFAHGVIKHRVIDVSFVVSRTLVYTILTSVVVASFVMVDFISSKLLDQFQIAVLLEAAVALAFGIWLNALHSRIDRFIDRTFFRRRHEAEARLERAANMLMHAETAAFVDEALIAEPVEALSLASAAVFRLTGKDRFERTASSGWEPFQVTRLTGADRIVVQLRAELQSLDLSGIRKPRVEVPMGVGQPLLAIPFVVRHELLGFVAYGGHRGGEAIDPEEIRALQRLADAGTAAYDHIEAQALRREIHTVQEENAKLRHGEQLVREVLDALRAVPRGAES